MLHLITDVKDKPGIVTNGQVSFIRPGVLVTREAREHPPKEHKQLVLNTVPQNLLQASYWMQAEV